MDLYSKRRLLTDCNKDKRIKESFFIDIPLQKTYYKNDDIGKEVSI